MIGNGDDGCVSVRSHFEQAADRLVERLEARDRFASPNRIGGGTGGVEFEFGPESMLQAVKIMKMDGHHRPIDASVGAFGGVGPSAKDGATARGLRKHFLKRARPAFPEDFVSVIGNVALDFGTEVGTAREGPIQAGSIRPRDDQAAGGRRRICHRQVEADDLAAGVVDDLPKRGGANSAGVIGADRLSFGIDVVEIVDAVRDRVAPGGEGGPSDGSDHRQAGAKSAVGGSFPEGGESGHPTAIERGVEHRAFTAVESEKQNPGNSGGHVRVESFRQPPPSFWRSAERSDEPAGTD